MAEDTFKRVYLFVFFIFLVLFFQRIRAIAALVRGMLIPLLNAEQRDAMERILAMAGLNEG